LVGPPGKTLLVKALAGEASVPVIIESGQMFQSNMDQHSGDKLKMIFRASKSLGPSLLFLDEIDKIGKNVIIWLHIQVVLNPKLKSQLF
jgi:ATP-dependent Zn protease